MQNGGYRVSFADIKKEKQDSSDRGRLVLAGANLSDGLKKAVVFFNRTNRKNRIEVSDYSSFSDPQGRMNLDLASGDIPDIINITNAGTMDILLKNHVLTDLYPFMEKDEEVNKEAFLPSVLKAMETDGRGNDQGI